MKTLSLVSPATITSSLVHEFEFASITFLIVFFFFKKSIGPMTILPLRRLYIERQVQPEMLNFVSTEEVVLLFNM